ncbi:siderophore synthetase component [Solirubrobacter pauli]|uniref:Siderophore synthetase component n=1 Tax=Solirubrobacter pauli TaxID=166793 RepID=A0A660L881_9ACTN|nr:IucA/IucC family protein [Solirubrobacter pauli]RKQ88123.1 siderophore synthetase component [Solirubrobacter pauli]
MSAWARANRELIAKLLTELEFEELLHPEIGDEWQLTLGELTLHYTATRRSMGHARVDPASLRATRDGVEIELPDADMVVAIGAPALGVDPSTTAGLIGEIASTLVSDAQQLERGAPVVELIDLDALELEGELRGHPWIVASKGRVGFGAADLRRYAPEAHRPVPVYWLDVADADWRGQDVGALVPVHPWQWDHRIQQLYAGDIARGRIRFLGEREGRWLPQQSIRTLGDADQPGRHHLKLALSILNTSVWRGLPRDRTLAAPRLSAWLQERALGDPFLRETGVILLGEVASVSVAHPAFEAVADVPYQHTELLGAIWRESVEAYLEPDERAISLAALLHRDPAGRSFVEALVERSGLAVADWIAALHEVTLPPLLHMLYRYGAAFSPHAQNCMLVLRDDVPVRLVVKDFVDDMMVSSDPLPELADMPEDVRAALGDGVEAAILVQWIQGGLLVCVHRYLAEILEERMGFAEAAFWALGERAVARYQSRFPELEDRFALFDMEAPAFVKLCLNRVRMLERGYQDAAERPVAAAVGWITNPLAP